MLHRSAARRAAALAALLTVAAPAAGAQDAIRYDGNVVEVRVARGAGRGATVCLETAPEVTGRKRAVVASAAGRMSVSTSGADHGPHCMHFDPGDGPVTVRLEYLRLLLFPAELPPRTFRPADVRGKTVTFRWVRG